MVCLVYRISVLQDHHVLLYFTEHVFFICLPLLLCKFKHYMFFVVLLKDQSLFIHSQIERDVNGYTLVAKDNSSLGISINEQEDNKTTE